MKKHVAEFSVIYMWWAAFLASRKLPTETGLTSGRVRKHSKMVLISNQLFPHPVSLKEDVLILAWPLTLKKETNSDNFPGSSLMYKLWDPNDRMVTVD